MTYTVTSFGKAFAHVRNCLLKKRKIASKGLVVKPLLSKDFNSRGQVDLVDMQSMSDGDFKFSMHYQDHPEGFSTRETTP
jgi:hypothetical protein